MLQCNFNTIPVVDVSDHFLGFAFITGSQSDLADYQKFNLQEI